MALILPWFCYGYTMAPCFLLNICIMIILLLGLIDRVFTYWKPAIKPQSSFYCQFFGPSEQHNQNSYTVVSYQNESCLACPNPSLSYEGGREQVGSSLFDEKLSFWLDTTVSKLARQITCIFIESKVIFRKNATGARPRANPCNNSGETEEVV